MPSKEPIEIPVHELINRFSAQIMSAHDTMQRFWEGVLEDAAQRAKAVGLPAAHDLDPLIEALEKLRDTEYQWKTGLSQLDHYFRALYYESLEKSKEKGEESDG